ncbi:cytosine deaminase-dependent hydrolase [Halolamina pelagica]|uniref:Cytosine deaminase-dependent hydrolase n=1 Tax=Halolamina pelagica TaxID=699431 RepID=A0A0P7HWD4_9EURY|nr:cytosine deaminase-dependent hydrolase [Halolamina pelagica]
MGLTSVPREKPVTMREHIDRRTFVAGATGAALTGLTGCLGGSGGDSAEAHVGMVYSLGGLGDEAFNDMAHAGIQKAEEELGIAYDNTEPEGQSEFGTFQSQFASSSDPNYDLVTCIGFSQRTALQENADEYPDQNFMLVDAGLDADNVASYRFREHEGSFQVGHLAGLLSTREFSHEGSYSGTEKTFSSDPDTKTVGFVGGKENPLIKKFEAGFIAGVHHADADIDVRSAYAGSWNDPGRGQEIAGSMYDEGADIVYHAAGATGSGVFNAAGERGRLAIGVDSDQSLSSDASHTIVASMVKHVDTAVFNATKDVVNDEFKGGSTVSLGLEDGGVEAVIGADYEGEIPQEVLDALDSSREAIQNGDIDVPTEPEN